MELWHNMKPSRKNATYVQQEKNPFMSITADKNMKPFPIMAM